MSNTPNDNTKSIVPVNKVNQELSNFLFSWVGTITYYNAIKQRLERYRSPSNLHEAHHYAINHIDSIIKELKIIAQATQRLNKKEELVAGIIENIGNVYEKSFPLESQEALDIELENTFSKMNLDSYTELGQNVEIISTYLLEKLYLSFIEEVESNTKSINNIDTADTFPLFNAFKNLDSMNTLENSIPKELCSSIYNDFLIYKELPLPALEVLILLDSKPSRDNSINELGLFGSSNSKQSSIIHSWKYSKQIPFRLWISSICGKVLAYYTLIGQEDKVLEILSKLK